MGFVGDGYLDDVVVTTSRVRPNICRIVSTAGPHGGIVPSGTVEVARGGTTNFSIRADRHYHVAGVQTGRVGRLAGIPGSPFTDNTFTAAVWVWSDVVSDGAIEAAFAENLWTYGTPETWLAGFYPDTGDYARAAVSDTDGDGHAAWEEFAAGTVPTDPGSVLAVSNITWDADPGIVIAWHSVSGKTYAVEGASNLIEGFTETVTNRLPATPPVNMHTVGVAQGRNGYYRVVVEEP
jgi:hypothetical protein